MNRVIVAGSRSFANYELLKKKLDKILVNLLPNVEIVSGGANGADKLGERYARERGLPVKQFLANWSKGKGAGYMRNVDMANYATHLVAFWDGKSRGTKHMIDMARQCGLTARVVMVTT